MTAASKVAVIVGGAGGIGRALAETYGRRGYSIALVDLDSQRLADAQASLLSLLDRLEVHAYPCDITNEERCRDVVRRILEKQGRIDVLILSAGLTQVSPFAITELAVYRRVMEVNFFGTIAITKSALPALLASRGQVVVLSSICGIAPLIGRTGYCASKHALHGFFDTLRCELKSQGVSVLMVCPSFVQTEFATRGLSGDGSRLSFERSTLGKPLHPTEVAEAIYAAAQSRKRLLVLTWPGKVSYWLTRLAPRLYERLMSRQFAIELTRPTTPNIETSDRQPDAVR